MSKHRPTRIRAVMTAHLDETDVGEIVGARGTIRSDAGQPKGLWPAPGAPRNPRVSSSCLAVPREGLRCFPGSRGLTSVPVGDWWQ
jgi:hypothetical protein